MRGIILRERSDPATGSGRVLRMRELMGLVASFVLTQPIWTAISLALLTALGGVLRTLRAGPGGARLWVGAGFVALAAIVLARAASPVAHVMLLMLCGGAALWCALEQYRARRAALSAQRSAACVLLRSCAFLALLLILSRPVWSWTSIELEKPLLVVLLDDSRSMAIEDAASDRERITRADVVNEELARASGAIRRLDALYDVRLLSIGNPAALTRSWRLEPTAPASALAAGLRGAARARSRHGDPPVATLLISDGAENVAAANVTRQAAAELGKQHTALLAIGVGPRGGDRAAVYIEPLALPARIGRHERLRVPVRMRVSGIEDQQLLLEAAWTSRPPQSQVIEIGDEQTIAVGEFDMAAPGAGAHRLTVRATLPADLGAGSFSRSAIVEVRDDAIRVLFVDGRPRSELAFASRGLTADKQFDVSVRLLTSSAPRAKTVDWSGFDVVVLGMVSDEQISATALDDLAAAVTDRGVGLLLAGGRTLFASRAYRRSDLNDVSPVGFGLASDNPIVDAPFVPTHAGAAHAVLAGAASDAAGRHDWSALPALASAARFHTPRTLATVLATDGAAHPLLVAQEVGRGRCLAAAWDATWPWALASDEGMALHRGIWRQMASWLANRRPSAWVISDRDRYSLSALRSGRQRVRLHAGISNIEALGSDFRTESLAVRMRLRRKEPTDSAPASASGASDHTSTGDWLDVALRREGADWYAELPDALQSDTWLADGDFELEFAAGSDDLSKQAPKNAASATRPSKLPLVAHTRFRVRQVDLELAEPTANLDLLRACAAATAEVDGGYYAIGDLGTLLDELAARDRRRRVERAVAFDPAQRRPWLVWWTLFAALGLEWMLRKRSGLV